MDERSLRLEQIRLDVQTNERLVDLKARRCLAVFAVGLTTGAASVGALVVGQVQPPAGIIILAGSAGVVMTEVRALGKLALELERGRQLGRKAIETLIEAEVETHVDASSQAES